MLSDSRACLDVIESVWRSGDANQAVARDRGAMVEAICSIRARFERVVFLWVHPTNCVSQMQATAQMHRGTSTKNGSTHERKLERQNC